MYLLYCTTVYWGCLVYSFSVPCGGGKLRQGQINIPLFRHGRLVRGLIKKKDAFVFLIPFVFAFVPG